MKLIYLGFIVVIILVNQSIFAQENVDIDSLIEEVSFNSQKNAFSNYSYKMEFIRRKKSFLGKDKLVKRFDVVLPSTMPKKFTYRHRLLLVYDNKNPLTASDILSSRNRIIKELEKDEVREIDSANVNDITYKTGGYLTLRADTNIRHHESVGVNLLKLIKNSDFSNYQELKVNGRDTISLDFKPKTDSNLSDDFFYLNKIEGIVLIDKTDKRIIKLEAFPLGKLSEARNQEAEQRKDFRVFHYLQTRVQEGFWFPKLVTLNFMKFPEQFDNVDMKVDFQFTKYQRFTTSVDKYSPKSVRPIAKPGRRKQRPNRPKNRPKARKKN